MNPKRQVLSKCQDSLPARPFAVVAKQVEEGLGKSMTELFESFDPKPLACASIAQVPKPSTLNPKPQTLNPEPWRRR
jgi:predicted unusual protein kinase regulating ubiquinone biosynthesis (AarF/ABC1/UbiB family)